MLRSSIRNILDFGWERKLRRLIPRLWRRLKSRIFLIDGLKQTWLLACLLPTAALADPTELSLRRIAAHRTVGDFESAVAEAKRQLAAFPQSTAIAESLIRSLADKGDDREALMIFRQLSSEWTDEKQIELLEAIGWSIIRRASHSEGTLTPLASLLGAAQTHDAQAISILVRALQSTRVPFRGIAAELSSKMRDEVLKDELYRLLRDERNLAVHILVIRAIGNMQMVEARPMLEAIIESDRVAPEEKSAAIEAVVAMTEEIDPLHLRFLIAHERAGMRELACNLVAELELSEQANLLFPLLTDCRADVRCSALIALGLLQLSELNRQHAVDLARPLLRDNDSQVSITAGWLMTLLSPQEGLACLQQWLLGDRKDEARLAAAAVCRTGRHGLPLAVQLVKGHQDPYVRANLALGLIGLRCEVETARSVLYNLCEKETSRWMWLQSGPLFRVLAPSRVRHDEITPNKPELVNQMTRLEVIGALAIAEHPHAQDLLKRFLKERSWGITGTAAITLLEEGDSAALDLIRELLKDPDRDIRVQAALGLAVWGKDPTAVRVLEEAYWVADRDLKIKILEAVGHIGSRESLPFLIRALDDPFPTLHVLAASSVVQCINN